MGYRAWVLAIALLITVGCGDEKVEKTTVIERIIYLDSSERFDGEDPAEGGAPIDPESGTTQDEEACEEPRDDAEPPAEYELFPPTYFFMGGGSLETEILWEERIPAPGAGALFARASASDSGDYEQEQEFVQNAHEKGVLPFLVWNDIRSQEGRPISTLEELGDPTNLDLNPFHEFLQSMDDQGIPFGLVLIPELIKQAYAEYSSGSASSPSEGRRPLLELMNLLFLQITEINARDSIRRLVSIAISLPVPVQPTVAVGEFTATIPDFLTNLGATQFEFLFLSLSDHELSIVPADDIEWLMDAVRDFAGFDVGGSQPKVAVWQIPVARATDDSYGSYAREFMEESQQWIDAGLYGVLFEGPDPIATEVMFLRSRQSGTNEFVWFHNLLESYLSNPNYLAP